MNDFIVFIGGVIMKCNIIDKFLYKLLFLTLILLLTVFLDKKGIISLSNIKTEMNKNINFTTIIKEVNGDLNIIDLKENVIKVDGEDSRSIKINENTYLYELKNKNVINKTLGSVIEIKKNNNTYVVTILDENNNLLTYKYLKKINVKMYQIIKVNDIVGEAVENSKIESINEGYIYYYELNINEN